MALNILDIAIIGGGIIGLVGLFFPKFLYVFANPATEAPYDKKMALKYRIGGLIILIIGVLFYVFDNFLFK